MKETGGRLKNMSSNERLRPYSVSDCAVAAPTPVTETEDKIQISQSTGQPIADSLASRSLIVKQICTY